MFNMSKTSKAFLEKNIPEILEEKDLRSFLMKLDDFITTNGLDSEDNITDFGHEAQIVYDEVYMCNSK